MDDVLVDLHVVAALGQRVELEAKLVLRGGDFVVVLFRLDAHVAHDGEHFAAHVLRGVDRRNREVAALDLRTVAEIALLVFGAGVVGAFHRVEVVEALVHADVEAHIVEDEEFGFRTEIGRCRRRPTEFT